ncbi:MAG TPA: 2-phospho-L-lactate transferase, partial [Dehalococcoidia bacterium]|nr:2-phospho-L-lactate transferase [Dehalococcoidia bacterium]
NTGDDDEFHGLYVSPDPDIVTYALAGLVDDDRGWGYRGETFRFLEALARFGRETWFQIGDRDLATHLHRTLLLRRGWTLSQVAADLARRLGVETAVIPMSDDPVRTRVVTDAGALSFQEYLVRRRARDAVRAVVFEGAEDAAPAPGVLEAIRAADAVVIAPSNPVASVGPILALRSIREAVAAHPRVVAVSPIIGGQSLQPPAAEMLAGLGEEVSALGVARRYAGLAKAFVLDRVDEALAPGVEALGMRVVVAETVMRDAEGRRALAATALDAARAL